MSILERLENDCGLADLLDEDTDKDGGRKNNLNQYPGYVEYGITIFELKTQIKLWILIRPSINLKNDT